MTKPEYTTVDQALAAYRLMMHDVMNDAPELEEEEVAHDCIDNLAWDCSPAVRAELGRTQLGYVPHGWYSMPGGVEHGGTVMKRLDDPQAGAASTK